MPLVNVKNNTAINCRIHGDNEANTVLLVSPGTNNLLVWDSFAQTLGQNGYRVVTYDHRGIGESPRGTTAMSVESLAEDAISLLDSLGIAQAHVIGWSIGSAVAQKFSSSHPQRVRSLVLYGTWAHAGVFQRAIVTGLRHAWTTGDLNEGLAASALAFSPELLDSDAFASLIQDSSAILPATTAQISTVAEQLEACLAHDSRAYLGAITAPTLVIGGEQDLLTPLVEQQRVADAIKDSEMAVLTGPGSSHGLMMERPEEFGSLVLDFLARH